MEYEEEQITEVINDGSNVLTPICIKFSNDISNSHTCEFNYYHLNTVWLIKCNCYHSITEGALEGAACRFLYPGEEYSKENALCHILLTGKKLLNICEDTRKSDATFCGHSMSTIYLRSYI